MKKTLVALCVTLSVISASALAVAGKADAPAPQINKLTPGPGPAEMPPHPPRPPMRPVLFDARVATDTPVETITKLTTLIPASPAKHYEVRIEGVPLPDNPPAL